MKHLARKIIKTYEKENNQILKNIPDEPEYKEIEAKAYILVSESVYRIDESEFSYNKNKK